MGCVSSKILTKSGSFQETVNHGIQFQRTNVIEEIILSSSKSNGDQFLALLCTSNSSSATKAKEPEQRPPAAATAPAADEPAKIETINVSELLAGLEDEKYAAAEQMQGRPEAYGRGDDGGRSPARGVAGGAAGPSRSFRTVEEFDALVTQRGSSARATPPAPEMAATTSGHGATAAESSSSSRQDRPAGRGEEEAAAAAEEAAGAKRRARARQLGELKVAPAFDFSKSGSLRDWLLQGGQTFSPGSYVTPKFGTAPAPAPPAERGGGHGKAAEQRQPDAVFDPELVAQFERAMAQLSEDEERVVNEILEAMELDAGEKDGAVAFGESERSAGGRGCAAGLAGEVGAGS
ncbi:hypothetical protein ACP4OV_018033 [Aristida adscensionis]